MLNPREAIFLVEDDQVDALCVRRALKELNIPNPLIHVTSGEEALNYLRNSGRSPVCLILLDINMPRMNGIEFLKEMRAGEIAPTIPVVVLTTSRETRDRCDTYRLGIAGYMVKPVDFAEFVRVMGAIYQYWNFSETAGSCY